MNERRNHPGLKDKFHAEFQDDIQVLVHDGGPRLTDHSHEVVWVRVTAYDGSVFRGMVLNMPNQLTSIQKRSVINFLVPDGMEYPLRVTEKYLQERGDWIVHACKKCGLTELFDAPSDLIRVVSPDLPEGAIVEMFTATCGACGGLQIVRYKYAQFEENHKMEE